MAAQSFAPAPIDEEAVLRAAAAVPLPADEDSDFLLTSNANEDDQATSYEDDESGMEVDESTPADFQRRTALSYGNLRPGELDVGPSSAWSPASLKDGTPPESIREIGIQCCLGPADLVRRRKYLVGQHRRREKKIKEKKAMEKRSREEEEVAAHPDAEAAPAPLNQVRRLSHYQAEVVFRHQLLPGRGRTLLRQKEGKAQAAFEKEGRRKGEGAPVLTGEGSCPTSREPAPAQYIICGNHCSSQKSGFRAYEEFPTCQRSQSQGQ